MRDTLRLVTSVALVEILVVMGLNGASPAAAASINGPYTYDQAVALGFLEPIAQKLPWCKKADPGFGTVDEALAHQFDPPTCQANPHDFLVYLGVVAAPVGGVLVESSDPYYYIGNTTTNANFEGGLMTSAPKDITYMVATFQFVANRVLIKKSGTSFNCASGGSGGTTKWMEVGWWETTTDISNRYAYTAIHSENGCVILQHQVLTDGNFYTFKVQQESDGTVDAYLNSALLDFDTKPDCGSDACRIENLTEVQALAGNFPRWANGILHQGAKVCTGTGGSGCIGTWSSWGTQYATTTSADTPYKRCNPTNYTYFEAKYSAC